MKTTDFRSMNVADTLPIKVVVESIHHVALVVVLQPLLDRHIFAKAILFVFLNSSVLMAWHVRTSVLYTQVVASFHELVEMLHDCNNIDMAVFNDEPGMREFLWGKK